MTQETETQEVKTDDLAALRAELAKVTDRLNKQDAVLGRKERDNQQLRETLQTRDDTSELAKAAFAALAERTGSSIEDVEASVRSNQKSLASEFEAVLEKATEKRKRDEYNKTVNELQKRITALGYGQGSPEYYEIFGRVGMQDIDGAYARLEELEAKKKEPKQETKKPEIDVEAIKEEERRKVLEEQGRLVSETGIPGGAALKGKIYNMNEISAMSPKEYGQKYPKGLMADEDFLKALNEGRVVQ